MKKPNLLIINSDSHNKYERRSHGIRISGISGAFEMPAGLRLGLELLCWLEYGFCVE